MARCFFFSSVVIPIRCFVQDVDRLALPSSAHIPSGSRGFAQLCTNCCGGQRPLYADYLIVASFAVPIGMRHRRMFCLHHLLCIDLGAFYLPSPMYSLGRGGHAETNHPQVSVQNCFCGI